MAKKSGLGNLLLLGGVAIGGYLLYKMFFGGQQLQGGGYTYNWIPGDTTPQTPLNQDTNTPTVTPPLAPFVPPLPPPQAPAAPPVPAVLPVNTVVVQPVTPNIPFTAPANTVLVQPNVPSGGITVIPSYSTYQPGTGTLAAPQTPQAPLNIQNIFGFPVVPRLGTIVTQPVTPVPGIQRILTPWGVSGGTVTTRTVVTTPVPDSVRRRIGGVL